MDKTLSVKNKYLWWLVIFAAVILTRLPSLFTGHVNIDENEYFVAASKILAGSLPYRDFLIYQPPIIYYFYALAFKLFGVEDFWTVHFLLLIVVILSSYFIYLISERCLAALFYVLVSAAFLPQDMLAANCEIIAVLPSVIAAWLFLSSDNHPAVLLDAKKYFFAGIFVGLAVLTKYQFGVILAPMLFVLFVSKRLMESLVLLAGFVAPILVCGVLLWQAGVLTETIDAWLYILMYAKGPPQSSFLYVVIKFMVRTAMIALAGLGVWYLALRWIVTHGAKDLRRELFLVLWFIFSFIAVVVGGRMYFHYYFVVFAPLCIMAAKDTSGLSKLSRVFFVMWGAICVIGFTSYSFYKPYKKLGVKDNWVFVADFLRENARTGENLFVWGYCPQLYISSGLAAATRFTTADYLTGKTPATAGLEYDPSTPNPPSVWRKIWNDFVDPQGVVIFDTSKNIFPKAWPYLEEDFNKRPPVYIVDTAPSNYRRYGRYPIEKYPYLYNFIKEKYKLAAEIRGYKIYRYENDY